VPPPRMPEPLRPPFAYHWNEGPTPWDEARWRRTYPGYYVPPDQGPYPMPPGPTTGCEPGMEPTAFGCNGTPR
jgi:hypothetical protein